MPKGTSTPNMKAVSLTCSLKVGHLGFKVKIKKYQLLIFFSLLLLKQKFCPNCLN